MDKEIKIKDYLAKEDPRNKIIKKNNKLKKYIVNYVGKLCNKENVTTEMIINVLASDFPEIIVVMAEQNYIRGYQKALDDVEKTTKDIMEENKKK